MADSQVDRSPEVAGLATQTTTWSTPMDGLGLSER